MQVYSKRGWLSAAQMANYHVLLAVICFSFLKPVWSLTFVIPSSGDLIGSVQAAHPEIGETLAEAGLRYGIGYYEMVSANPQINPLQPLSTETRLIIPSQFILPQAAREGLVINLAEYRLYYYPPHNNVVITMPIGIGREGWTTPQGITKIIQKERNPVWRPTESVRAEAAKNGMPIPHTFPGGEGNPLGKHVLRLGWPTYLIHGSNRRNGIGARVSAGCIRMLPEDIEYLFELVVIGTPVTILNEPIKLGRQNGAAYIEVHPLLAEQKNTNLYSLAQKQLKITAISHEFIKQELESPTGIPRKIHTCNENAGFRRFN